MFYHVPIFSLSSSWPTVRPSSRTYVRLFVRYVQAGEAAVRGAEAAMGGAPHAQLPRDRAVRVLDHVRGVQLPDHEPRGERKRRAVPDPRHLVRTRTKRAINNSTALLSMNLNIILVSSILSPQGVQS